MAENQAYLFLIFTLNGVFIGLLFDFFRILRQGFKTNNIITYIQDIIFWTISGLSIIFSMVNFSNGTLRFFMVIGIIIGFITYILTFSKYIRKFSISIIKILKKIVKFIWRIIIYPFKIMRKIIIVPLKKLIKNIYKNVKKVTFLAKNQKMTKKVAKKSRIFLKKVEK